ncbi:WD repeat protein [Trichuris trichiura]|uniref:WD repeat protein n=1 Tax=Trichuris trichiura TaxID=36087 RepID=A0A077ZLP2_TRITR|nr:WD repeat protein [Trichuris trichiura]
MSITTELLRNLRLIKIDSIVNGHLRDFGFSRDGLLLACSTTNDALRVYYCKTGKLLCNIDNQVQELTYDDLRLLSITGNVYAATFQGHTDEVTGLDNSPIGDLVVSSAMDDTVRLWDFRVSGHVGKISAVHQPAACFNPFGNVIAVVFNMQQLCLFDIRAYSNNTLASYILPRQPNGWASVKFSPNGKFVLLSSYGRLLCQVVLRTGQVVHSITERTNLEMEKLEAFYSPDGNYLITGTSDGHICFFHQSNAVLASQVAHETTFPVKRVQFNPKYLMLASSCGGLNFWVPKQFVEDSDDEYG